MGKRKHSLPKIAVITSTMAKRSVRRSSTHQAQAMDTRVAILQVLYFYRLHKKFQVAYGFACLCWRFSVCCLFALRRKAHQVVLARFSKSCSFFFSYSFSPLEHWQVFHSRAPTQRRLPGGWCPGRAGSMG